ncbi:hypothetical protein EMIT091MI3_80206 [Kosakonia quasisacchari]
MLSDHWPESTSLVQRVAVAHQNREFAVARSVNSLITIKKQFGTGLAEGESQCNTQFEK